MTALIRYEAIKDLYRKARSSADDAVQFAVECGHRLIVAKKVVAHGEWAGCVFLNPPCTVRVIDEFIDKMITDNAAGEVRQAVLLTNNSTDISWFHRAVEKSSAICFTRGRINFNKPDGNTSSPTNDQAFFYFVPRVNQFTDVFGQHGLVMVAA